ncbi:MAG: DUF222 domain-containing protein [Rhodoglobus sp.]
MANLAERLRISAEEIASHWRAFDVQPCPPGAIPSDGMDTRDLDDASLLASVARLQEHITLAQSLSATLVAEIQTRSARDLGHSGLAARNGFTSPEKLVQAITKSTKAEAIALVHAGRLLRDADLEPVAIPVSTGEVDDAGCPIPLVDSDGVPVVELVETNPTPWLVPVAAAVTAGTLSVASASAIKKGLGDHTPATSPSDLLNAARMLVEWSSRMDADQLFTRARQLRDEVDAAGVADRERALHDGRYLKIWQRPDGTVAGSFQYGPEDGALLIAAINAAMSPRRGGPRFVDPDAKAQAQALLDDPRTNEQLQADAFIAAMRLSIDADPHRIYGHNRPAVKVLVIRDALVADDAGTRTGFGRIEGTHEAVSLETIDRHMCDSGTIGVSFTGDGQALNLGRETRLFSKKQREVMAARDGGCIGSDSCQTPPAMCEAHHTDQWSHDGRTDVDDGVLLCRFHHMNFHNNGYRIIRDHGSFWLIPPPTIDPAQTPIRLNSNNPDFARHASG